MTAEVKRVKDFLGSINELSDYVNICAFGFVPENTDLPYAVFNVVKIPDQTKDTFSFEAQVIIVDSLDQTQEMAGLIDAIEEAIANEGFELDNARMDFLLEENFLTGTINFKTL